MKEQFIKTSDEDTASKLRGLGFTAIAQEGKYFVFLNDGKQNFSQEDDEKIVKTDILCI